MFTRNVVTLTSRKFSSLKWPKILQTTYAKISSVLGRSEEDESRQQRKKINDSIDNMFKGAGLPGFVAGVVLKQLGNFALMYAKDVKKENELFQLAVENVLLNDSRTLHTLGNSLRFGPAISSSINSINVNGSTTTTYFSVLPVEGSIDTATITTSALKIDKGIVTLQKMSLRSSRGIAYEIDCQVPTPIGDRKRRVIDIDSR